MPQADQQQLVRLDDRLSAAIRLAHAAMRSATAALLGPAAVIEGARATDDALHRLAAELDAHAAALRAGTDPPEADDLRAVVAGVPISTDVESMGELARLVGDIARSRWDRPPAPARLHAAVAATARSCLDTIAATADAMESVNPAAVAEAVRIGTQTGRLREALDRRLLSGGIDVRTAIDLTLVGRCYERGAGRAVAVARHVAFLAELR
ncbi:hypothetical protein [Pseudonocardia acidicola]|uniref:Phosphate transport system protein n=1 Tax=Pseudonocardia acidicola TaxID=2724939 RepID=A0ABX1SDT6_9PSEU|nr:hypothetical protein [Pseudonocardia acidicola]NMH99270.1 hypothetical protein [Pseudonocardia acidicola]